MMHDLRELDKDLRQTFTIPGRGSPVHWRADHVSAIRVSGTHFLENGLNLLKNGVDPVSRGVGALDGREEVGDARHDADGRLIPGLDDGVGEDGEVATGHDLGSTEAGIGTTTSLSHMVANVRITENGENR